MKIEIFIKLFTKIVLEIKIVNNNLILIKGGCLILYSLIIASNKIQFIFKINHFNNKFKFIKIR